MKFFKNMDKSVFYFTCFCILVVVFKIEMYPISNYQMYGDAFLPGEKYKYMVILQVSEDGTEKPFFNKRYGFFHSQGTLVEAVERNLRAGNGKDLKTIGTGLLKYVHRLDPSIVGFKFYEMTYDWEAYKKSLLTEDGRASEAIEQHLVESITL